MHPHAPQPHAAKRTDRKPKMFCQQCGKSRRMTASPGGWLCPAFHFRKEAARVTAGPVDAHKASQRNA